MRTARVFTLLVSAFLVAGCVAAVRSGAIPLGVTDEWEWLRPMTASQPVDVFLAGAGVAAYSVFAGLGMSALRTRATPMREAAAVATLLAASVAVQAVAQLAAPPGYGLEKCVVALYDKGSSGYFTVAKNEVQHAREFLTHYPDWIQGQDALHIGTHPPGLIVFEMLMLRAMEGSPAATRFILDHVPRSVAVAFRVFGRNQPMADAERATIALTAGLTLLACAGTVVPLYVLARSSLNAPTAWATASLWPLVPSAILFQPTADTAFPLLSTLSLALTSLAGRPVATLWRRLAAVLAGVVLGVGMQFTLAFLPVGLIVAVILVAGRRDDLNDRLTAVVMTGLGFLVLTLAVWAATRANPFVIWWWNQKNHGRFYSQFSRNYRAWVLVNPVELAVALGLPVTVWAGLGVGSPRSLPRVGVATAVVLAALTLSGKNLSEVARLWLPFMPALLVVAGVSMERLGAGPKSLAVTVGLVGAQTLMLETLIQVVYPV